MKKLFAKVLCVSLLIVAFANVCNAQGLDRISLTNHARYVNILGVDAIELVDNDSWVSIETGNCSHLTFSFNAHHLNYNKYSIDVYQDGKVVKTFPNLTYQNDNSLVCDVDLVPNSSMRIQLVCETDAVSPSNQHQEVYVHSFIYS